MRSIACFIPLLALSLGACKSSELRGTGADGSPAQDGRVSDVPAEIAGGPDGSADARQDLTGPGDGADARADLAGSDVGADARQDQVLGNDGRDGGADTGACFPACYTIVSAACPRSGTTCISQAHGTDVDSCYSNGVKVKEAHPDGGSVTIVTETDGVTTCYSFVHTVFSNQFMYYDATGTLLATVETISGDAGTDYRIVCGGTTTTVTAAQLQNPSCVSHLPTCVDGTCL